MGAMPTRLETALAKDVALWRVLSVVCLGVLPLVIGAAVIAGSQHHAFGIEFLGNLWRPARDVLAGRSPYHPARVAGALAGLRAGHPPPGLALAVYPAYPAPALLLGLPFAHVSGHVAAWLWMVVLLASSFGALRLMGVRDWRCYGAAALSITLLSAVMLGSVTPLMLLGAAAAWRYRDRWRACALAVASLIALKLILWPLVVWLWFTGRRRAAATSLAGGLLLVVAG